MGASMLGMRPIVDIMFTDFSTLAMDQIINQAAKARFMSGGKVSVPVVIKMQSGAGRGKAAQHSQSFEAIYSHVPRLKVVIPYAKPLEDTIVPNEEKLIACIKTVLEGL